MIKGYKSSERKRKKSKSIKLDTFTKVWVNRNMIFSWICIFWCFLLASFGREQVAENLAVAIVINIVGVFVGYFAKSFFETREEKKTDALTTTDTPIILNNETEDEDEMIDI